MHPREQHYSGGGDAALAAFGLTKVALMTPAQREAFMAARKGRPTGLAAVQTQAAQPVANVQASSTGGGSLNPVGGPGMAAGFGGRGVPLEPTHSQASLSNSGALPSRNLPTSMSGIGSIRGQAAIAERAVASPGPTRFNLPKLASFLLSTA